MTIVIPAYNHARYLREAIDSVLNQNYKNIELIVLDDGSTDETQAILEGYEGAFTWETQKNMGQAGTLNKGWNMAQGGILAYVSADDFLYPEAVSKSVECLLSNPDAVQCYCDFDFVGPNSEILRRVAAPEYSYMEMLTKTVCAPSTGAFFLRSAFLKTTGWDPQIRQFPDFDYWLRLGLLGRFVHIHESLGAFRVHEGSQSFAMASADRAEEAVKVLANFYRLSGLPDEVLLVRDRAMASAHLVDAQAHVRAGRFLAALRQVYAAVKRSPRAVLSFRSVHLLIHGLFHRCVHRLRWSISGHSRTQT